MKSSIIIVNIKAQSIIITETGKMQAQLIHLQNNLRNISANVSHIVVQ